MAEFGLKITTRGTVFGPRASRAVPVLAGRWVGGLMARAERHMASISPVATRSFVDSLTTEVNARGTRVTGSLYSELPDAAVFTIEGGRRAGAPMPPPGALLGWMAARGIPSKLEWLVRRGIARKGYGGHFVFARTYQWLDRLLRGNVNLLALQIVAELER